MRNTRVLKSVESRAEPLHMRNRPFLHIWSRWYGRTLVVIIGATLAIVLMAAMTQTDESQPRAHVLALGPTGRPQAADAITQTISVERPAGQVVLTQTIDKAGHLDLTLTDTRDNDPGWSIMVSSAGGPGAGSLALTPVVVEQTPAFTDSDGHSYAQQVHAGTATSLAAAGGSSATLASAPAHHGLGIAHFGATLTPSRGGSVPSVTLTVV